jgi:hypothetical protein
VDDHPVQRQQGVARQQDGYRMRGEPSAGDPPSLPFRPLRAGVAAIDALT